MSKAFALANFRVGYLIASKDNVQFINRIRNPKNLTTFAQTATIAALTDVEYMNNYTKEVNLAKCWFKEKLETLKPMACDELAAAIDKWIATMNLGEESS